MVAPYIYAHRANPHDWTMKKALAAMFASLQERGWNMPQTRLSVYREILAGQANFLYRRQMTLKHKPKLFARQVQPASYSTILAPDKTPQIIRGYSKELKPVLPTAKLSGGKHRH